MGIEDGLREGSFGETESRFRFLGTLGSGGFGAVYEAVDARTGHHFAVKVLDNTSADSIARFKREFRALADCHHPNLVGLKELIEENGRWLIVMELVEGQDLLNAVRRAHNDNDDAGPSYDEARLRTALIGMAQGLRALHGFGVLHRDMKPSNVRVRGDGRAVLLDFGLATRIDTEQQSMEIAVGTVRYMAPEQISQHVGPAADFYALGVCLFEALTGRAPFDGEHPLQILVDKQQKPAPLASSFEPRVPPDLDHLCARLLATDPAARPSADELLELLGAASSDRSRDDRSPSFDLFAGRDAELEHLERALARTDQGELRVVLIEGESGVGKSELAAEFVRRAQAKDPSLVALRGRCYENEQVAYKAFDGCVDELARVLRRFTDPECAAVLPLRATLLGQLFPVLRNVPAVARAPVVPSAADPAARRLEAFRALSSLLTKLAEERPLVLVVDDLQWADVESFRLLNALVEPSERPPLLLLATIRPREELEPDVLAHVEAVRRWKHTDVVRLFGLPRAQAKSLAATLLGDAPAQWLEMIAEESQGHPLFLSELVQYAQSHDFGARARLTLDAALRARVERLDWRARELLELVALAARPLSNAVFAHALSTPDVYEVARGLLASKLLKARKGHELGCYHDRIRHTVVALIARTRLPALHYRLAAALSATADEDAAEQARHWDLAGENERAIATYETAIARSLETLAFVRAAALCARALELLGDANDERRQQLLAQSAHALACAGRSGEAALLYQAAAETARGELRIRFRTRAAQQLMLNARLVEGFEAARALLRELGVRVPRGALPTVLRMLWDRLCLELFGRRTRPPSRAEQLASEVIDELMSVIGQVSPLGAIALAHRRIRLSSVSEIGHGRWLAGRAWMLAASRSLAAAEPLFEEARRRLAGDPAEMGMQAFLEGSARLAGWDCHGGSACLDEAHRLLGEHTQDRPWQITQVRYHLGIAWYHLGAHARIARETSVWLAEARERNDRLGAALIATMGFGFLRHLLDDAPEAALRELDDVLQTIPQRPFSFAHFGQLSSRLLVLLYQGGSGALRWIDGFEAEHGREFLMRTTFGSDLRRVMRALALITAYKSASGERDALRTSLAAIVRKLARSASPYTRAYSTLLAAQLAVLHERREEALAAASSARMQFESIRHANARSSAFLEGLLEGGSSGRAKQQRAIDAYAAEGWRDPVRGIALTVPAVALLAMRTGPLHAGPTRLLLGRYELREPLGSGGAGQLVAAHDRETGRELALKELVRQSGASLERFKREFRALQGLHHENLARLEALFEHEGRWYMALERCEGAELRSYLTAAGGAPPSRLRAVFVGLARGLGALHEAGFVLRELTPESVRITAEARPVIIDFGLIARAGESDDGSPIGASEYAAPELIAGAQPAPSADAYALGRCLQEVLRAAASTGGPSEQERELRELDALARALTAREPRLRPTLVDVIGALDSPHGRLSMHRLGHAAVFTPAEAPEGVESGFTGRERELGRLAEAFERTADDGFTVALVQGESGVGKSSLVAEFARRTRAASPGLIVLESRCYENEQIAFKAFDGAIDQLALRLRQLPNPVCESLLPRRAALLAQLFPVLGTVPAIEHAPKKGLPAEATAQKLAARDCFIQLLASLSQRQELLFVVDDLQWADGESFALLSALLAHAEKLPIFFLCTVRKAADMDDRAARECERRQGLRGTELIELVGLSDEAASRLARSLYGEHVASERLALLVRESKGHPLFLRELVEHDKSEGGGRREGPPTLEQALRARIASFSEDQRELLGLVATAGRPLGAHQFARAMGRELPREAVIALLAHGILRRRGEADLACHHDLVRHAVLDALSAPTRRALAHRLALALDDDRTIDPSERARLWDEAGERARAASAYAQAGDRALEGLAFARAEQHYARALALLSTPQAADDEAYRRLVVARATALARAGRSREAAREYQRAAEHAAGEAHVRLRILAAQQLLQSAEVKEGMQASAQLLSELGLSLPASEAAALRRIAWERARAALRGTRLPTKKREVALAERLALEALRGLSSPVRDLSYLQGSTLVAQYLRRALVAGDPNHAARALAYEALWRVLDRPRVGQAQLLERSRELADRSGDPALIAEVENVRGLACVAGGQFKLATPHLSRAHEFLLTRCPGEPWLLTNVRMYLGAGWHYSGDMVSIGRHMGDWIEEARARDDRYAQAALCGFGRGSLRHLLQDQPTAGLEELAAAFAPWPDEPFSTLHYGACLAQGGLLAYRGGEALLAWMEREQPRWRTAYLMRTPACQLSIATFNGWALTLAAAERSGSARDELLVALRRECAILQKSSAMGAPAVANYFLGVLEAAARRTERALVHLSKASEQLAAMGHHLAPSADYVIGMVEGGDEGRRKREVLHAIVRAEGWADQQRGIRFRTPGLPLLT